MKIYVSATEKTAIKNALNALASIVAADGDGALRVACLVRQLENGMPDSTNCDTLLDLAYRIDGLTFSVDEPRFSGDNYADAVCNMPTAVNIEKLLNLEADEFEKAMVGLAQYKWETYAGLEHADPTVLSLDIF